MRTLSAIIWYELLMQLKSMRFRGMCALALLFSFGLYQTGAARLELLPSRTCFDDEILPFYVVAIVFAGLFPVARVRQTGMHPVLMVRPFPTFTLVLGQLLAALLSLLLPLAVLSFVPGLILRWQFGIDYHLAPVWYVLLFYFLPGIVSVLAVTIWIRACFKGNIAAIICLGVIFAGAAIAANSKLLNTTLPTGQRVHNFVPMVSLFSGFHWSQVRTLERNPLVAFTRTGDWLNLGLSLVLSWLFVLLSCYHLRRTEPHRKVLGTYGRRWYHAPTFLRMACDLRIDPHIRWPSHMLLFLLLAAIGVKAAWPVIRPHWEAYRRQQTVNAQEAPDETPPQYAAAALGDDRILPLEILRDEQVLTEDRLMSTLTFRCTVPPADRVAVVFAWARWSFEVQQVTVAGREAETVTGKGMFFIEGHHFSACCDGEPHTLTVRAIRARSKVSDRSAGGEYVAFVARGYAFAASRSEYENDKGETAWQFKQAEDALWPTRITYTAAARDALLDSPVLPESVTEEPPAGPAWAGPFRTRRKTYVFEIPSARNGTHARLAFGSHGVETIELPEPVGDGIPFPPLRVIVSTWNRKTMTEILDLARPVFGEFCSLHGIAPEEPLVIWTLGGQMPELLRQVRCDRARYRRWGSSRRGHVQQLFKHLDQLEGHLLGEVFSADLRGRGPQPGYWMSDLLVFLRPNLARGLNHRLSMAPAFLSPEFSPVGKHVKTNEMLRYKKLDRTQLYRRGSVLPLFQMLYLVMGHDAWSVMLQRMKLEFTTKTLSPDMLQPIAEGAYGEPLDWFMDYWCRDGEGYPSYRVDSAKGQVGWAGEDEEEHEYRVEATVTNVGTGRMPVPVRLETAKAPINDRVWIGPGETVTWRTKAKHLPKAVVVDPDQWIFMFPYRDKEKRVWIAEPRRDVELEDETG